MDVIKITMDNFESEVVQSDRPVLIDFFATWCGPCKMLAPVIEEIAKEREDIKVCKVNVDEEQELSAAFSVNSIPMLVMLKDGEVQKTSLGFMPKDKILQWL